MSNLKAFDYRYNPFTQAFSSFGYGYSGNDPEEQEIPAGSPYFVTLDEIPRDDSPTTLSVKEQGGSTFTEVSAATNPAAGQYRVIYGGDETQPLSIVGQGTIEFNSADAGKTMEVSYYGMGSIIQRRLLEQMDDNSVLYALIF